jgi:glycosyltransferase involved in cell wall biosynthesis
MRIVIDLQGAQTESRFRGIGRYSLSLTQAFLRNTAEHDVWIVLNARMPESINYIKVAFADVIPENRIRIFDVPCDTHPSPWMARASELIREAFLDSLRPDFVLITSLFEGYWANAVTSVGAIKSRHRTAVILYDLIPFLNKNLYLPNVELKDYYYKKIDWLKKSDLILAISESSRQEGIKHLSVLSETVSNISASIDEMFRPLQLDGKREEALLNRLGIKMKTILYVPGGFDPRKNFTRLIEAFSLLENELRKQYQLVIAGKILSHQQYELQAAATRFGLGQDELILTGYLEDQELIALYSLTDLFVFPSTHEGFGLPVLEAMSCGAPTIGSNCSSIPEVIGLSDALFDPLSVYSITKKLTEGLTNDTFRAQLREHARHRSKFFSWDASAKTALKAMETNNEPRDPNEFPTISEQALITELVNIADSKPTDVELRLIASSMAFNEELNCDRQLLLDVSTIVHGDAKSGIQRVVRSLLKELLLSIPNGVRVKPIYFDGGIYRYANNFTANITGTQIELDDLPIEYYQNDIYLALDLNMHLSAQMHQLHERMHMVGVKLNFIVYDLLLIHRPDWWLAPNPEMFEYWLHNICLVGDSLVCISQAVAEELRVWLRHHQPARTDDGLKVTSFHLGADIDNSLPTTGLPVDSVMILKKISTLPSFLVVGTIEPRKGHSQTLAAFESLWAEGVDINLVIVGKEGWLVDELIEKLLNHVEVGKRLFWLEGISDAYLEKIYAACTCLIASSEGEGFGLPLIEAAHHKLPIIARDIPVFREVVGENAFYFTGLEPKDLAQTVKDWIELFESKKHPGSEGMPWLTWSESASQLLDTLGIEKPGKGPSPCA